MMSELLERLKRSILDLKIDATIENVNSIVRSDAGITVQEGIDSAHAYGAYPISL